VQHSILVIEDNPDIQRVVTDALEQDGYTVITADNGTNGLISAREHNPDLVILDLGLPDFKGDEVARRLRKTSDVPILVLTAMDAVDRKLALFQAGANDYLTKPFNHEELLARVHVQFRKNQPGDVIQLGDLAIYPNRRLATWRHQELPLSPREFDILLTLAKEPGRVLSRAELQKRVWGDKLDSRSNVVDVHFANLRSKLRQVDAYGIIRTVRGVGYGLKI